MKDILAEIVAEKKVAVSESKKNLPLQAMKVELQTGRFSMSQAVRHKDWVLIAECKLQSPAKGRLCKVFTADELAHIYEVNGAGILSVHTDKHFLGCNEDFRQIRQSVGLPLLRKDFIIDEYQIYESRFLGADAILLIVRLLSAEQLKKYLYLAWALGMDALLEVHDEKDINKALATPAEFIGINNRNLQSFTTSVANTYELLPLLRGQGRVLISESGISEKEEAAGLYRAGLRGILVGEGLVKAEDIAAQTAAFAAVAG